MKYVEGIEVHCYDFTMDGHRDTRFTFQKDMTEEPDFPLPEALRVKIHCIRTIKIDEDVFNDVWGKCGHDLLDPKKFFFAQMNKEKILGTHSIKTEFFKD